MSNCTREIIPYRMVVDPKGLIQEFLRFLHSRITYPGNPYEVSTEPVRRSAQSQRRLCTTEEKEKSSLRSSVDQWSAGQFLFSLVARY